MTDAATSVKGSQGGGGRFSWLFVVLVVLVSLAGGITKGGIWEPPELEVAEFSRRIAVSLLGGEDLRLAGVTNSVPTQTELARGQLPFTSIALGFRVFGLHPWAGRVPLVAWGLMGVLATSILAWRFAGQRVAALAALVLGTMPLYFVQAKTMLGETVALAALSLAVCCLALAVFGRVGSKKPRIELRILALVGGAIFCFAGVLCRGIVLGAALPLLAVGVSFWLLPRTAERHRWDRQLARVVTFLGLIMLVLGAAAIVAAVERAHVTLWSGLAYRKPDKLPAFDGLIQQLGHGLIPWSAFLPVALWGLGSRLQNEREIDANAGELAVLAVLVQVIVALSFVFQTLLAPWTGVLAFSAVFALALAVALALERLNTSGQGSRAVGVCTLALLLVFCFDFQNFPDKMLTPLLVNGAHLPVSLVASAKVYLAYGVLPSGLLFALIYSHRASDRLRFGWVRYRLVLRTVSRLYAGNLQFVVLVVSAGAAALRGGQLLSDTFFHFVYFENLGLQQQLMVRWLWLVLPFAVWGLPFLLAAMVDSAAVLAQPAAALESLKVRFGLPVGRAARLGSWLASRWPKPGSLAAGVFVAAGLSLSLGFYPAVAAQLSPMPVLDSYRALARSGEPLAMFGSGTKASVHYYAGGEVVGLSGVQGALGWLFVPPTERRWLVVPADELAALDSAYRHQSHPSRSLPILNADSSESFLASSRLGDGPNRNPFVDCFSSIAPTPLRRLDANLGDVIEVLGWEVRNEDGIPQTTLSVHKPSEFVIFYKVIGVLADDWRVFLHIDGKQLRFNGDHPPLGGRYPARLWKQGDYVRDVHRFTIGSGFPPGHYQVYLGLYSGDRRLEVRRGAATENRLQGGVLELR